MLATQQPTATEVKAVVYSAIQKIMQERGLPPRQLLEDDKINATLGLRSLDLAQLVFDLETTFGADPFEKLVPITSVRTVAEFVGAYMKLYDGNAEQEAEDELLAAQRAGQARRQRRGVRE